MKVMSRQDVVWDVDLKARSTTWLYHYWKMVYSPVIPLRLGILPPVRKTTRLHNLKSHILSNPVHVRVPRQLQVGHPYDIVRLSLHI